MMATFAIEVRCTAEKYKATLRPKHTPPSHERLTTSHESLRRVTSKTAVSTNAPIHSR